MHALIQFIKTEIGWIIAIGIVLVLVQIGATLITATEIERTSAQIATELAKLQATNLVDEKTRQEVLNLRIQNEIRGFLSNSLLVGIGPMVTAFVALVGALLGLRNYLASREKDRLDRQQALEKEQAERDKTRLDRASTELKDTMDRLVKDEPWQRAAGILGLQHFLAPDLKEYHLRGVSALAMAARMEGNRDVIDTIRIALEQAVKTVDESLLQQVNWQWVKLPNVRFAGRSLRALDLRNATLNDADLSGCDLSGALLNNALLKGAKLDRCHLTGADLAHADLAGASLLKADLRDAALFHAKVLRMDIAGADLRRAKFDPDAMPWELITNWRKAQLDDDVRQKLIERFGPEPTGPKILMLMWEVPPFVAGGTWTACYHLVRNLRRRGADLTVVVPWDESLIVSLPFGAEVRLVALGIEPPEVASRQSGWSAYGVYGTREPSWSPYASTDSWSSYSSASSFQSWSPYGWLSGGSPYATARGGVYGPVLGGPSMLLRLIDECRRRFVRFARSEKFDVVHAHDWVTFEAAAAVAQETGKRWIAHFHSIERDRRPTAADHVIERIERRAAENASAIVTPSRITADRLVAGYQVPRARITIVPNSLSREPIPPSELGLPENRRAIFLGRLTAQKGPDLFANIVERTRPLAPGSSFDAYGSGEMWQDMARAGINLRGNVEWNERGSVFGNASALVVPSRFEPFGMVILEAMLHRVPVLYPASAGAAEVLKSGIRIDPTDSAASAEVLARLLRERDYWEETVLQQREEITEYVKRGYEERLQQIYRALAPAQQPA